jgi:aryl-alcohol dehydrogenase-like predicted oxidoreductase
MVSDISLGSGRIRNVDVPRALFERGVTYVDTAPDYADAGSEKLLGEAMRGHRDKMFVATKFCRPTGHLPSETPVPEIIAEVEKSLQRLQTDHVDLIHIHSCDRVERLMAPNIHEAFDRLKEQGKARFLGVSTHTPNLEEVANTAIDSGRFDVMMLAYHFGMWPTFGHILEKAKQHDVAVVAMKTLKGAKHTNLSEFRREAGAYSQSAFRCAVESERVVSVISFSNRNTSTSTSRRARH